MQHKNKNNKKKCNYRKQKQQIVEDLIDNFLISSLIKKLRNAQNKSKPISSRFDTKCTCFV